MELNPSVESDRDGEASQRNLMSRHASAESESPDFKRKRPSSAKLQAMRASTPHYQQSSFCKAWHVCVSVSVLFSLTSGYHAGRRISGFPDDFVGGTRAVIRKLRPQVPKHGGMG